MSSLIERYITVATRNLPEGARAEAAREIRVMIDELVEARLAEGEEPAAAEAAVLNGLGDPVQVARSFEDRPHYLIGPTYYEQYISLVKILLSWLPITAFLAILTINVLTDDRALIDSFVRGGLDAAGTAFVIAVQIVFWVTLTFAILERSQPSGAEPEATRNWTISDLPADTQGRQIGLGESAWGIGIVILTGTLLLVQHVRGIEAFVRGGTIGDTLDGRVVPFINPDIPSWVAAATFALLLFALVSEMVKFAGGHWTVRVTVAEILASIGFVAIPALVIYQWGLVNPEIDRIWGNELSAWLAGRQFEMTVVVVMIVLSLISIVDAIRGYRAYRQRTPDATEPGSEFVFIV